MTIRQDGWYPSQELKFGEEKIIYDELCFANSNDAVLCKWEKIIFNKKQSFPVLDIPNTTEKRSNPTSWNVEKFCEKINKNFIAADVDSKKDVSQRVDSTMQLLDSLRNEKYVLVGSGVGAHVSLLLSLKRPDVICGIVGLNAKSDDIKKDEMLDEAKSLPVHCPIRLMCTLGETAASLRLAESIASEDVVVEVSKSGLDLPYAVIKQCFATSVVSV